MMADKKGSKGAKGGDAPASKKGIVKLYARYKNGKSELTSCPKCGNGTFMAKHKNRNSCGKCGYTEFAKKV